MSIKDGFTFTHENSTLNVFTYKWADGSDSFYIGIDYGDETCAIDLSNDEAKDLLLWLQKNVKSR